MRRATILISLLAATLASPACVAAPQTTVADVSAISREPLYADIVRHANALKSQTEGFAPIKAVPSNPAFATYVAAIRDLSADVLKAHLDLKARGTDNDLKCILKGVALDLDLKLEALVAAPSDSERATALQNIALLLSDTSEVIVTPATADSGLDCVIEFGAG